MRRPEDALRRADPVLGGVIDEAGPVAGERWRPHRSLATAYLYSWRRDSSGAGAGTSTP